MIKSGLLEERVAGLEEPAWRTADDGTLYALRATGTGLLAVGADAAGWGDQAAEPEPSEMRHESQAADSTGTARLTLRSAAQALLAAWDTTANGPQWLAPHFDALREATTTSIAKAGPRQPRPGTKRAMVLAVLRRSEGSTIAQVMEATGWAKHTVHGFFASLKKAG